MLPKYIGQSRKYYLLYEVARKLDHLVKLAPNGNWGKETAEKIVAKYVSMVQAVGGVVEDQAYLTSEIQHLKDIGIWDKLLAAWIPSGYAEGKLYAVKGGPEADLGFTRAGTRTRVGPSGLVEEVPYNLVVSSSDYSSNAWQKINSIVVNTNATADPLGGNTGCELNANNSTTAAIYQNITLPYGRYALSFYIKKGTSNQSRFRFIAVSVTDNSQVVITWNGDTPVLTPSNAIDAYAVDVGNGWHRVVLVDDSSTATTSQRILLYPDESGGNGTLYVWGHQIVSGENPLPYFSTTTRQHVPAIDFYSGAPSLSLEKASTNLLRSSNDFGNSTYWTNASSIGITPASILSPKGILNGVKLTEANTSANHQLVQGIGKTGSALQYTLSVYAKKAERNWIRLQVSESANGVRVWFNLDTGEIGTTLTYGSDFTLDNAKISPYKDGWYRCEVTCTSNASTSLNSVIAIQEQDNFTSYAGDGESGIYVYQAQLELGAYATSDIPTGTSTASRIADSFSGNVSISNSGTLYFEVTVDDNTTHKYLSISDGTTNNRIGLGFRQQGVIWGTFGSGGSVTNLPTSYPYSPGQKYKIAITWIDSTIKVIVDGEIRSTSNSFVMPIGVDRIITGNGVTSNSPFYGNIERLAICDYLTDAEAIALTTL